MKNKLEVGSVLDTVSPVISDLQAPGGITSPHKTPKGLPVGHCIVRINNYLGYNHLLPVTCA